MSDAKPTRSFVQNTEAQGALVSFEMKLFGFEKVDAASKPHFIEAAMKAYDIVRAARDPLLWTHAKRSKPAYVMVLTQALAYCDGDLKERVCTAIMDFSDEPSAPRFKL